ncbi:MAG: efflux RND transporter periplasmic adaptor subunit [Planctomycetota bacterium]
MEILRHIIACVALAEMNAAPPVHAPPALRDATSDVLGEAGPVRAIAQPARRAQLSVGLDEPIVEIFVQEGDRVEAGQPIARLDDRLVLAQLASAEAKVSFKGALAVADAELGYAKTRYERMALAHEKGAASFSELQDARLQLRKAEAARVTTQENMTLDRLRRDELRAMLERHTIVAPFAGVVERINADAGETPGAANPIVELVETARLRVEAHLPAARYGAVAPGDTLRLHASDPVGTELVAIVDAISPVLDAPTRTFRCIAYVDNANANLPAGLTVTLAPPATDAFAGVSGY